MKTLSALIAAIGVTILASGARAEDEPAKAPQMEASTAAPSGEKTVSATTVYAKAEDVQPLKFGAPLPAVSVKNAKGETVTLADATKGRRSVIVFYRGGWCPFCNKHLADLATIEPQLAASGIPIIAISPDSPETITAYGAKHLLPYTLLSDSSHDAIKAFGVAFAVDAETQQKYKGYGIDLAAASGNADAVLPTPSVFIVDPSGKITYSHTNPDYKSRMSGAEILKAAGVAPEMKRDAKMDMKKEEKKDMAPK
ncbi:hypothetical protein BH09SUM1_BH09SUM1_12520 [soil metagenome]